MVSANSAFGGSKSKSKSRAQATNKTVFPKQFLDEAYDYFGDEPAYDPKYVGFNDFDKLEKNLYDTQQSKLYNEYDRSLKLQNEELSNSGLLNSPSKYIAGGARDTLNQGYISGIQQAARDAALGRLGAQQTEVARETGFNVDTAKTILQNFMNKLALAAQAGRESESASAGDASGFSFNTSGGFSIGGMGGS